MATFHDRTTAPRVQRGLLRSGGTPCRVLTTADVLALTADRPARARETRDRFVKPAQVAPVSAQVAPKLDLLSEPLLPAMARHGGAGNQPALSRSVPDYPSMIGVADRAPNYPDHIGLVEPSLDTARAIYLRRQLEAAAEHGAHLLAALGLPRIVTPDFVPLDPVAIGKAVEQVVAALDALDGDVEIEDGDDAEHDTADLELSLGWNETVSQLGLGFGTDDSEATALERHGCGFLRSGPEDAEEDDPAGAGLHEAAWWERPGHPPVGEASHG